MNLHYWVLLMEGAMRNGMSLKEAIEFLLLTYDTNWPTEWINCNCETAEERRERLDQRNDEGNEEE